MRLRSLLPLSAFLATALISFTARSQAPRPGADHGASPQNVEPTASDGSPPGFGVPAGGLAKFLVKPIGDLGHDTRRFRSNPLRCGR